MPSKHAPRKGSMQFYPRKRSSHKHPRIRSWAPHAEPKLLGFAGYKVGMTHALIADKRQFSQTKGASIAVPCTVLECPPLKAFSLRFYKTTDKGYLPIADMLGSSLDKSLERSMPLPKSPKKALDQIPEFDDVVVLVHTSPGKTGIGKKMPEIFEISVGGTKEQKLAYAKSILDKEINVSDIFKAGMLVDAHAITKGKGLQGPVKRHGITLKHHKSEKSRRNPGSLGGWRGQVNVMWQVAHAGQTGYHQRTEFNKWIMKVGDKPDLIPSGGFLSYGVLRNPYLLIKGSLPGAKKRLVKITFPVRPNKKLLVEQPNISFING